MTSTSPHALSAATGRQAFLTTTGPDFGTALVTPPGAARWPGGQLRELLAGLSPAGRDGMRYPHPEVLQVPDPRPVLDEAAILAARCGGTGLLVAETLAAGLTHGRQLWFGTPGNVGSLLRRAADELGIAVHVAVA